MTDREAFDILQSRSGTMYDPRVVQAFFGLRAEIATTGSTVSVAPVPVSSPLPAASHSPDPSVGRALESGEQRRDDIELEAFFALGRLVSGAPSAYQIGEALWATFGAHLRASAFVLYAYDEASDAITAAYTAGDDTAGISANPIPLGDRLSGWVAATGQTVMNSDARLDLDDGARARSPLRSALSVALTADGRSVGVLSFYARASNAFDDAHRRILEAASRLVGPATDDVFRDRRSGPARDRGEKSSQNSTRVLQK
jgi:GAF domain-containing protein